MAGSAVAVTGGKRSAPAELGHVPDEIWDLVAGHCPTVRDLVALATVNKQLHAVVTNHETTITTPVFASQRRVRQAWKHLPFGIDTDKMACVRTVETGHRPNFSIQDVVVVGEWVVTCCYWGLIKVWEQHHWTCVTTVEAGESLVSATECDGMLVTGAGVTPFAIKVWKPGSWTLTRTLHGHTDEVVGVLGYEDKYLLSCSHDGTVRVWSRTSWKCERVLTGHTQKLMSCMAVHDGKVYCGHEGYDEDDEDDEDDEGATIRVIDTTTWATVQVLEGHTDDVTQVLVWGDKVVSCSCDHTIKVWSTTREDWVCEQTLHGHTDCVFTMAVLGDKLISGSDDATVRVWGMRRGLGAWECERVLGDHGTGLVRAVICMSDGRRVVSIDAESHNMRVWEET